MAAFNPPVATHHAELDPEARVRDTGCLATSFLQHTSSEHFTPLWSIKGRVLSMSIDNVLMSTQGGGRGLIAHCSLALEGIKLCSRLESFRFEMGRWDWSRVQRGAAQDRRSFVLESW